MAVRRSKHREGGEQGRDRRGWQCGMGEGGSNTRRRSPSHTLANHGLDCMPMSMLRAAVVCMLVRKATLACLAFTTRECDMATVLVRRAARGPALACHPRPVFRGRSPSPRPACPSPGGHRRMTAWRVLCASSRGGALLASQRHIQASIGGPERKHPLLPASAPPLFP